MTIRWKLPEPRPFRSPPGVVALIRNPLGDSDNPLTKPRVVAATTPITNGFPDDLAVATQSGLLLAAFQARDLVLGYDVAGMIKQIELAKQGPPLASWSQLAEEANLPSEIANLTRGPISTIPIDSIDRRLGVAADFRFFTFDVTNEQGAVIDKGLAYGIPLKGPVDESPNRYGPLPGGNLPRGLSVQPNVDDAIVLLAPTPYNETPTMQAFPNAPFSIEAGVKATAEVHSGALHESHQLVSYRSLEQDRMVTLTYDSLRAEPKPIFHFAAAQLDSLKIDPVNDRFAARLTALDT